MLITETLRRRKDIANSRECKCLQVYRLLDWRILLHHERRPHGKIGKHPLSRAVQVEGYIPLWTIYQLKIRQRSGSQFVKHIHLCLS
jgi:hypothetical protein